MITRDAWGIPHVTGGSVLEVAHEQGRATAQDRAWQLEVERRRSEGTCAEVFGATALEWDLLARRVQLVDLARRAYDALEPASRAFVDAYVDGANDVLDRPWRPWTPLGVFAVQHLLFSRFPSKLWQHHVASVLGDRAAEALELLRTEGLPGGSNAVAADGALTASGLPIVAGDPHRVIEAPGCYAQVRLTCTDPDDAFDVAGLTFVGVPGVQHFGHAGDVAWGVTNAVADDEDICAEELQRHRGAVVARGRGGWEPVVRRVELVRVRTGDDTWDAQPVEVLVTSRGPVVTGGPGQPDTFSLRTPAGVLDDLGFDALLPLLRSRSAADVTTAFDRWVSPVDNLLVADTSGHVEHRVVGRVPLRADGGWTGWVEDQPRRTGPLLVSANDRATAGFSRIGDDFAAPHRAHRLAEVVADLAASAPLTPEALGAALADDRQVAGEALLSLAARLADLSPAATALRDRLLAWDRRMATDSVEAALFASVRAGVVEAFATAPALAGVDSSPFGELYAPWFDLRGRLRIALPALLAAEKPFGVDPLQALAAALEEVAVQPDPAPWGDAHVVVPLTPEQQLGLPAPDGHAPPWPAVAGDDDCVLATRALGGTGACVHGPVARWVWDLAGDSRWVVPLGASGDPASPHHHDQQAAWAAGRTIPLEDR
ncbi:penicillin amidase [Nocardioides sp. J9]|uniref:penicillin acylase family protein n=1 Tax=Nocardioides sp. J9 TaxID=935844 RepID=UPI0011A95F6B|nr:penicillin acylase family protein [Nocardioides sp. J9]TWH04274.1 penicillin amidase [Nocardioides sp. J9]